MCCSPADKEHRYLSVVLPAAVSLLSLVVFDIVIFPDCRRDALLLFVSGVLLLGKYHDASFCRPVTTTV